MVLRITLSEQTESRLSRVAAAAGMDVETYAARLLDKLAEPPQSMSELSGPAYEEFLASGMTDDQLGDFLEAVKHEMRTERRRRQAS